MVPTYHPAQSAHSSAIPATVSHKWPKPRFSASQTLTTLVASEVQIGPQPDNRVYWESLPDGTERFSSDAATPHDQYQEITDFKRGMKFGGGDGGGPGLKSVPLFQALDQYIERKKKSENVSTATLIQTQQRLSRIIDILGRTRKTTSLKRNDMAHLEDHFIAHMDIKSKRKGRRKADLTASPKTTKDYIRLAKSLMNYCFLEGMTSENFADCLGKRINMFGQKASKQKNAAYSTFSMSDVKKIFTTGHFAGLEEKNARQMLDIYFWAPLIALYSGMRSNEICQTRIGDIQYKDGVWFISIDDLDDTQSAKTVNAIRKVPIHDELIRLGFLNFVFMRREQGNLSDKLFRGLNYCPKNKWSKQISRWFNGESNSPGHLDKAQLQVRENKCFHSFRHTFVQGLRDLKVGVNEIASIVGHEEIGETGHYGTEYALQQIKDIVNLLRYPVDLSHIDYHHYISLWLTKGRPSSRSGQRILSGHIAARAYKDFERGCDAALAFRQSGKQNLFE